MYYPGNSNLHLSQAKSGGAVIGFRLKDETKAQAFVDALTLPLVSVSLGGVETILTSSHNVSCSCSRRSEKQTWHYIWSIPSKRRS